MSLKPHTHFLPTVANKELHKIKYLFSNNNKIFLRKKILPVQSL